MLSRVLAAAVGGYALSAAATVWLSIGLPGPRPDAVLTATMASILLYGVAALWVFAASSAARAWLGVGVPAAVLSGLAVVVLRGGGT